jgi:hypothetical protein
MTRVNLEPKRFHVYSKAVPAKRESDIEKHLVKRVKELGGEVRKVQWIGRRGAPDRLVMLPREANCIWVELKAPGEKPRPEQAREHDRMRAMGQLVVEELLR